MGLLVIYASYLLGRWKVGSLDDVDDEALMLTVFSARGKSEREPRRTVNRISTHAKRLAINNLTTETWDMPNM